MKTKIFNIFARFPVKAPGIKRFVHDYSFPIAVTLVFLIVVTVTGFLRASQKSSLTELLTDVTSRGQGYGTLLSKDKTDELKKYDENPQTTAGTPTGAPSSFAISNTGSSSLPANGAAEPAAIVPAPAVFSASIASFRQDNVTLECSTPKPKRQTCSKRYVYGASVRANNGPGQIKYGWRSNLQSAIGDGSVSVGGGSTQTSLQKVITLDCGSNASVSLQFIISSPSLTQSAVLNINHNCNEI